MAANITDLADPELSGFTFVDLNKDEPVETPDQRIKSIFRNIEILRSRYKNSGSWDQQDEVARMLLVCEIVKMVHDGKSKTYGPSWKKRGWVVSIFGNIARKFDRLEKIFTDPSLVLKFVEKPVINSGEESVTDTIADIAVYSLLAMTEQMVTKPEIFDQWLRNSGIKNN